MQDKHIKTIAGYKLTDRLLGQGVFSRVLLARSAQHQRVAVKVIPREAIPSGEMRRFERAVEALRGLSHEHLVRLVDFKKSQNNFYLFLQLCEGGSLADYIRAQKCLPESQALRILKQVLLGVRALHQSRHPHRDIKPANILLHNGCVKISHFGLRRRLAMNQLFSCVGPPLNVPPQMLCGKVCDHKSDVYTMGAILYQMLYGCVPFKSHNQPLLQQVIDKGARPGPRQAISQRTQNLLKDMLTPQPENRIELLEVLDIVGKFQIEAQAKRIQEYRANSLANQQFICVPGGLSCGLSLDYTQGQASEMDQRLYGKLCRSLSAECQTVQ